jgi:predicted ArsR family transcriptional regulator
MRRRGGWRKPAHRQELVMATVISFRDVTIADIARQLHVSREAARLLVDKLVDKGILDRDWRNGQTVRRSLRVAV